MNSFEWMQSRHFSDKHQYSCSTKKKTPYRLHSFRQPCIAIVRHLKDKELCLPSYLPVLWTINNVCVPKQFCSDCRNNGAPLWPSLHLWIMQSELSSGLNAIIWKKKKKKSSKSWSVVLYRGSKKMLHQTVTAMRVIGGGEAFVFNDLKCDSLGATRAHTWSAFLLVLWAFPLALTPDVPDCSCGMSAQVCHRTSTMPSENTNTVYI